MSRPLTIADAVLAKANWNIHFKYNSSDEYLLNPAEKEKVLSESPMNPRESVGPKARPNPTIHQAKAPVTASKMFFTTIPLQCCFFAAEASTIIKPSCMKKMRAVDAMIQLELAPVLIVSRTAVCAAVNGSTLAKFLEGSEKIPVFEDITS